MIRAVVSSFGGLSLAILEIFLLWKDTQRILKRKAASSSRMLLRLLVSGGLVLVFLRFFQVDVVFFLLSFSVAYFSLVVWLGVSWRDENGRDF
ncbi:MAG: hypothetical protein ACP5Q4_07625 [Candidatus Caldatribacteriaceae bacterium]